jgi:hypothetical protein
MKHEVRIGGACGYWGDSAEAPRQLVEKGDVDYLVFDYLAEVTMSILVRAKAADPEKGYALDFVSRVMVPLLPEIRRRGIKVVVNAGGVNISACARALADAAKKLGITLKVGTVEGDDLLPRDAELRETNINEMFSGKPLPKKLSSANAYLGAFPIAAALGAGADVVVTGRCVDSAVTLGILIHEFGWGVDDYDRLAAGTLAGHILECGAQATGGNFSDWSDVAADWEDMGYPIAVCRPDGAFEITKPPQTGGLVSRLSIGEQILYEIGDTRAYVMPDVICDFSQVNLDEVGHNRVAVAGARGTPPTKFYKVSATHHDGFRSTATTLITGFDAVAKARRYGDAIIARTRRIFAERGLGDYTQTAVHLIGAETLWGQNRTERAEEAREVVAQIEVRHSDRNAIEIFSREVTGVALSMTTGRAGVGAAGRPEATPVVAQFAFLIEKSAIAPTVRVDEKDIGFSIPTPAAFSDARIPAPSMAPECPADEREMVIVPLVRIAVARSGDKGNSANVGIMARRPELYDTLCRELTPARVKQYFGHVTKGAVHVFPAPGFDAINILMHESLGGGGTSSLNLDKLGKTYGQQILAMSVRVPAALINRS